jgi:predicted dehydrogenase
MASLDLASIDTSNPEVMRDLVMNGLLNIKEIRLDETEPLRQELESFVASVRDRTEPLVPASHGLRAIRLATEILKSIQENRW